MKICRLGFSLLLLSLSSCFFAQNPNIYDDNPEQRLPIGVEKPRHHFITATGGKVDKARVEPPFWWTGMAHPELEVLIYDQNISDYEVSLKGAAGVRLAGAQKVQNPNYLFVELEIGPGAPAHKFDIVLTKGNDSRVYPYEFKSRQTPAARRPTVDAADFIYLLMPDRFANGDPTNDSFDDMNQVGVNRSKMYFRHGGDLKGVMDHLDYFTELGVTALWLNPVLENNQPYESYHGYAITDFYNLDKRFGNNELYKKFVDGCHAKGLKVVMDIVFNHCGSEHWFIKDLPSEDWVHQWKEFTKPNYRETVFADPYTAESDRKKLTDGWFDNHMPDLNQRNPRLANYLIQNIIWWTEYSGQDAYRIDTYFYPDQAFMARWAARMQEEFPGIELIGEVSAQSVPTQAVFTQDNHRFDGFNSHLPAIKDFQLAYAIAEALNRPQGWTEGASRLYYVLAQDFLYKNPFRNLTFLDNHDMSRFLSVVNGDEDKLKAGLAFLLTTRGIPSMYYGTEMLMKGTSNPDGKVRQDMPGGWQEDKTNKFTAAGRTPAENAFFNFVKKLANYRKINPVLQTGKLTQFIPENGIYVYFRYNSEKTVMCILNTNDRAVTVPTQRYEERMLGFTKAKNVVTDTVLSDLTNIEVGRVSTMVLELR